MTGIIDRPQADIQALMSNLPVSGLEPARLASLGGFIKTADGRCLQETVQFLEPPAGQHVPYINPMDALEKFLRRQGAVLDDARLLAREAVAQMKADIADDCWVNFFDDLEPESPEYLRVPDFVAWLRNEEHWTMLLEGQEQITAQPWGERAMEPVLKPCHITEFIERAAEVATATPMFWGLDNWRDPWPLSLLPAIPPPLAMMEFMPVAPWADIEDSGGNWTVVDGPFLRWRESMRSIARELEQTLGESVYHFADLDCETDDDAVHRFLVLHWCCSWKPQSAFVRYLLKVSGAKDVDTLKAALIDPANYIYPFALNDGFCGLETSPCCRFDYLPPEQQKTVVVLFSTPEARDAAQLLLAQKIGAHALIVAPKDLATDDWVEKATRYCRDSTVHFLFGNALEKPIEILALADEICVIANERRPNRGFDLKLSEWAEELLWMALELGLDAKYFDVDRTELHNPEVCLEKCRVSARVAARAARRMSFKLQLTEIRLNNDLYSSGLSDREKGMIGYDLLDLPFTLIRRIAKWQRNYDDAFSLQSTRDEAWWEKHNLEELFIAKELQAALGNGIPVTLRRGDRWIAIGQIDDPQKGA
jgi:hypothetical protein